MSKKLSILIIGLLAFAAVEFGLLGADAAGLTGGASHALPPISQRGIIPIGIDPPTATPTATATVSLTPIGLPGPVTIQITAQPLEIRCDGSEHATLGIRLLDAAGAPVPDGTVVYIYSYNGNASPSRVLTSNGYAVTSITLFGDFDRGGPNVLIESSPLSAGIRIRCLPGSACPPFSPPKAVSPPCASPTPFPCNPSPGSGAISPPCVTPNPCNSISPRGSVSASCPPVSPPSCELSPPSGQIDPRCVTPTPYPCIPSPGSGPISPPCPSSTPTPTPCNAVSPPNGISPPCAGSPTPPPGVSPPYGTLSLALDCTPDAPTSVGACIVPTGATTLDVPVVLVNDTGAPVTIGAFNFYVHDADTTRLLPLPGIDGNFNGNPDANEAVFSSGWRCDLVPPSPDLGTDGPGRAVSRLVCFAGGPSGPTVPNRGGKLKIATIHYSVPANAPAGGVALSFGNVAFGNVIFNEVGSCLPQIDVPMGCFGTTVQFGSFSPPPAATALALAVDCDTNAEGIQANCGVALGATALDAAIVLTNDTDAPTNVGGFQFDLHDADTARLLPIAGVDANFNGNPDFNEPAFPGSWSCAAPPPSPDLGLDGPGRALSRLVCYVQNANSNASIAPGGSLTIATVHYRIPASATAGSIGLSLSNVVFGDSDGVETGSCNPPIDVTMACTGATVRLGPLSPPAGGCAADVNGDGRVTSRDLALVLSHFGRNRYDPRYDVNHDGRINSVDALIVRRQIGRRC